MHSYSRFSLQAVQHFVELDFRRAKELEDYKATDRARKNELEALTAEVLDLRSLQISKDQELADLRQKNAGEREVLKAELVSLHKIFDALKSTKEDAEKKTESLIGEMEKLKKDHVAELYTANQNHAAEVAKAKEDHAAELSKTKEDHAAELLRVQKDHAAELSKLKEDHTAELLKIE